MLNFEKFGCNRLTNVFQHPLYNLLIPLFGGNYNGIDSYNEGLKGTW